MAEVLLRSVSKAYPQGNHALGAVSLQIAEGTFNVLLGPSGSGKSTLLRLIAGLEAVSSGEIIVAGRAVNDVPPKDRDVAMVFQSHALYPHLSIRENLAFGLKLRHCSSADIEQRIARASQLLRLGDLLTRHPAALSGGERQRVALGRAIVREPQVFLFDEPLSNLDARLRLELRSELKHLHQTLRTTTLHVTHDQDEALALADSVIVLDHGSVQQVGTPTEIYRHPANRFVAEFVGTPTMNFFDGVLLRRGSEILFEGDGKCVSFSREQFPTLAAYEGHSVVLGERPERMHVAGLIEAHYDPFEPQLFLSGPYGQNLSNLPRG